MREIFVNQDEHSSWRMCTAVLKTRDHSQASFGALGQSHRQMDPLQF